MDTMKDTKMPPAKDAAIEELRELAEDLYVNGYNRYSSAMSKAADEIECLQAKIAEMERQKPAYWGPKHAIEGGSTTVIVGKFPVNPTDVPLYTLPGAQPAPSVPDGYKLMPIEPTKEIYECFAAYDGTSYSNPFGFDDFVVDYGFALEAAPEVKP